MWRQGLAATRPVSELKWNRTCMPQYKRLSHGAGCRQVLLARALHGWAAAARRAAWPAGSAGCGALEAAAAAALAAARDLDTEVADLERRWLASPPP